MSQFREDLIEVLTALGEHLGAKGQEEAIVVVGGASLSVLGLIPRATADVDVIAQAKKEDLGWTLAPAAPFSESLQEAIDRVARDFGLPQDWLNSNIGSFRAGELPPHLLSEVQWHEFGGLTVGFVGRRGLIPLKLFAAVDNSPSSVHYQDLLALEPSDNELSEAADWVTDQDAAPAFPTLVREVVESVQRDLASRR